MVVKTVGLMAARRAAQAERQRHLVVVHAGVAVGGQRDVRLQRPGLDAPAGDLAIDRSRRLLARCHGVDQQLRAVRQVPGDKHTALLDAHNTAGTQHARGGH